MPKYHMRKSEREITDPQEILDIIRHGKFITIAMCRANEPYIVTLSYGFAEPKNSLYFHAATEGLKLEILRTNPEVCATVIEDLGYVETECEQHYKSAVIHGKMYMVAELAEKKYGLDILLNHLEKEPEPIKKRNVQDDSKYSKVTILRLDITEVTGKKAN
ncbi:pyridoxamine 5'-phosphate oxidase family protein [[Eubacterium] cellulosolvens]